MSSSDDRSYAALLAQVIPVVLLAIIVEARGLHGVWIDAIRAAQKKNKHWRSPNPLYPILSLVPVVSFLSIIEFAMLAVSSGHANDNPLIRWLYEPFSGAIAVGLGFVYVLGLNVIQLSHRYYVAQALTYRDRAIVQWVIRVVAVLIVIVTAIIWR